MKSLVLLIILFFTSTIQAQEAGDLFTIHCGACHSIGRGKLVGPDLKDITTRRDADWLLRFIKSPQDLINKADPEAVKVFEEYNKILMPNSTLNETQIKDVLNYIKGFGNEDVALSNQAPTDPLQGLNQSNIDNGRALFLGETRFQNNGVSCFSCHNVMDQKSLQGGSLAKDLTLSFSAMGATGIMAIIKSPPFPVMTEAYVNHPLTETEVADLTIYLKSIHQANNNPQSQNHNLAFLFMAQFAFLVVLSIILYLYRNRKNNSVNDEIYRRQSF
ncbi:MAG: c-type cytochrome [Bacteroidales bacterium]|nr:c-type cytochrome [Bacteroidales bacterium]